MTIGVVLAKAVPPDAAAYHLISVPVTAKLAKVGTGFGHTVWVADPVGTGGIPGATVMLKSWKVIPPSLAAILTGCIPTLALVGIPWITAPVSYLNTFLTL